MQGTVSQAWGLLSVVIVIVMFILLVLWHSIVRLMFIAMAALVVWGIVSLLKPNTGFGPVIITGLYAVIPAIYISHLFSRADLGLPGRRLLPDDLLGSRPDSSADGHQSPAWTISLHVCGRL